jgi:transcriptional regulator with XRE-family HTH domain
MRQPRFNRQLAKARRVELGLDVEEVAEKVGRSIKSIYAYEGERAVSPPPSVRRKLERLYGLDRGALLTETESTESAA